MRLSCYKNLTNTERPQQGHDRHTDDCCKSLTKHVITRKMKGSVLQILSRQTDRRKTLIHHSDHRKTLTDDRLSQDLDQQKDHCTMLT